MIVDEINDYVSNTSSILELLKDSKSNIKQCNLKIKNLKEICKNADILITNIGKNCFINEEYIKEQSIIIDISAKYTENGMIIGDVVTNDALEICNTIIQIPNIIEKVAPMLVIYKLILSII